MANMLAVCYDGHMLRPVGTPARQTIVPVTAVIQRRVYEYGATSFPLPGCRVGDISEARVVGLSDLTYLDNTNARAEVQENSDVLAVGGEVDRIYVNAPNLVSVGGRLSVVGCWL